MRGRATFLNFLMKAFHDSSRYKTVNGMRGRATIGNILSFTASFKLSYKTVNGMRGRATSNISNSTSFRYI